MPRRPYEFLNVPERLLDYDMADVEADLRWLYEHRADHPVVPVVGRLLLFLCRRILYEEGADV